MRPSAIFPVLCAIASLVLGFLCIFAGDKRNWMEDYHILTLNTSRIGQDVLSSTLNSSSDSDSSNWLTSIISNVTSSIESELNDDLNSAVASIAQDLGIEDFYSAHLMDYCYGDYVPQAVANASVSQSEIHKNVSGCSNRTALYYFDPTAALEKSLNDSSIAQELGLTLDDLDWPDDIQDGLRALRVAFKATFVLYCIGVGLVFVSLLGSIAAVFLSGRLSAFVNILIATLAFLALALASAIVTAVAVKGSNIINKYGNDIGVEAHRGGKFMAITWAATVLEFLVLLTWCVECCIGRRHTRAKTFTEKP